MITLFEKGDIVKVPSKKRGYSEMHIGTIIEANYKFITTSDWVDAGNTKYLVKYRKNDEEVWYPYYAVQEYEKEKVEDIIKEYF